MPALACLGRPTTREASAGLVAERAEVDMLTRWCAVGLLLVAMACGDDDGGATIDAGPDAAVELTLADLCDAPNGGFVQFFEKIVSCYPEIELLAQGTLGPEDFSGQCYAQFQRYFEDGSVKLADRSVWNACLAYLASASCDDVNPEQPDVCRGVIVGNVPLGGDCDIDDQCAGDAYCRHSDATCGACTARAADGVACQADQECGSGLCFSATNTCRAVGDDGDACGEDGDCKGRRLCDGDTKTCAPPRTWAASDECTSLGDDCGFPTSGLYCDEGAGRCTAYLALGATCTGNAGLCNIPAYEFCAADTTQKCTAGVEVDVDEPCGFLAGRRCKAGLVCSDLFDAGTCRAPLDVGDTCEVGSTACGLLMDCVDGTCAYDVDDYSGMCPASSS
jgi:hypothetical protein